MSIRTAIYERLRNDAAVIVAVGVDVDSIAKVYPVTAPTEVDLPYITFDQISGARNYHLLGSSGLIRTTIQVNSWSETALEADTISEAVRAAIDGLVNEPLNGVVVSSATIGSDTTDYTKPIDDSQEGTHVVRHEYELWHAETVHRRQGA